MDRSRRSLAVAAALAATAAACAAAPAAALADRTLHVTTTKELSSGPYDPGACAVGGDCSLRQAINAARGQDTTVVVPAGTYALTMGELDVIQIAGTLTLAGDGAGQTVIEQETPRRRVLNVHVGGQIVVRGATLTGGEVVGADGADGASEGPAPFPSGGRPGEPADGGGVYSTGHLTLAGVVVSGNSVTGGAGGDGGDGFAQNGAPGGAGGQGRGGGVWSQGTLLLERTRVGGNVARGGAAGDGGSVEPGGSAPAGGPSGVAATGTGGGVHVAGGELTVLDSWLEDNDAIGGAGGLSRIVPRVPPAPPEALASPSGAGQGGGLGASAGRLTVTGSTISQNVAAGGPPPPGHAAPAASSARGGGLHLTVPITALRSTIAENVAGGSDLIGSRADGGGIWTSAGGTLTATTVASNVADADNAGRPAETGGNLRADGPPLSLRGALVVAGDAETGANCAGSSPLLDRGGNVQDGVAAQCAGTLVPEAGTLKVADNGGVTPTAALPAGSPAIDAGACTDTAGRPIEFDQRGVPRPAGAGCDAGAFELLPEAATGR